MNYLEWIKKVSYTYNISVAPPKKGKTYTVCLGKGNNT